MKFNEKLVLNSFILSLFAVNSFEDLAKNLKESRLENLDENDNSLFYHKLKDKLVGTHKIISDDKLQEYDENIVRHTLALGRGIKWKYFQYLSLLFIEIYLDKYFDDKEQLLVDLNTYLREFNTDIDEEEKLKEYDEVELNKLALYSATGSGKTLLMQMNILQFNHWSNGKIKINKTVLITPNEGLSNQHLEEFQASNIEAGIFSKDSKGLIKSNAIEIIEITKLGEENGDKTVAVDSFEDNNLVFIDEGHRGSSGDKWKTNRDKLSANGFAFEYSATFAQAINSATGTKKKELENEYTKAIIFDYSYKYFYNDGYGKDYSILNLSEDSETIKQTYLTASLLSFYQQMKIYESSKALIKPYLIEKPLMVFVGSSVNAVRKSSGKDVSDVVDVLLFINKFIENRVESIANIDKIMSFDSGLNKNDGSDIFAKKFDFLEYIKLSSKLNATAMFDDILNIIFNASSGILHIENLKGVDGEIALKIGENEYFGIINVGDSDKLVKTCDANGMSVASRDFSGSLFKSINDTTSNLNILIGSKKFSEGWSSWRVSTMGLMNIGKKEGSQIIQLFGRGVRLKGYNFCLKRSSSIKGKNLERKYRSIETLSIFGLKADYMKAFRDYLKDEGIPTDERVEFILPLIYDERYKNKKLKVLDLKDGKNFKREVKLDLEYIQITTIHKKVILSLYKQVDELASKNRSGDKLELNSEILASTHLSFINSDNLFFALQQFKNEKNWSNLNISKKNIEKILQFNDWYKLLIPKDNMNVYSFKNLSYFETIIITLLKKYMKAFYEYKKSEWESQFLEYRELDETRDRANLIDNYTITVEDKETELIDILKQLEKELKDKKLSTFNRTDLKVFNFDNHLYNPLIYTNKGVTSLSIKPIELNDGEKDFVEDLGVFIKRKTDECKDIEIYLLRNQSKSGLGFFTDGNFYPDFIMWIVKGDKQYITFIDPKGIRNSNPRNDPKMNLSITIKEIEAKLGDTNTVLNSFILSNTSLSTLNELHSNLTYQFFEDKNVLFQVDRKSSYIKTMFDKILS
ncbi:MAG: DEAD/DEAH box helicase family protein [Sulfurospirillum sp.]|nr:DEAD/DEAH box helicase family protein [Sulfurospirillum sp.]